MRRFCIALIDSVSVTFLTSEHVDDRDGGRDEVVERDVLTNAQHAAPGGAGDQKHAGFARFVLAAFRELIDDYRPDNVVVWVAPRMRDAVHAAAPGILPETSHILELPEPSHADRHDVAATYVKGAQRPTPTFE